MLIFEWGNNHLGNLETAKEMIHVTKESGGTLCKFQAFYYRDVAAFGSMPTGFYHQCEFSFGECVELIDYGKEIDIDVFYSIFSPEYNKLKLHQKWHKISASQTRLGFTTTKKIDKQNCFISVPKMAVLPPINQAQVMFATEYMPLENDMRFINNMKDHYGRPVGLSDHNIGIDECKKAIDLYGVNLIEKHCTLEKDIKFEGKIFRDSVHGALPHEMEELINYMKGGVI